MFVQPVPTEPLFVPDLLVLGVWCCGPLSGEDQTLLNQQGERGPTFIHHWALYLQVKRKTRREKKGVLGWPLWMGNWNYNKGPLMGTG